MRKNWTRMVTRASVFIYAVLCCVVCAFGQEPITRFPAIREMDVHTASGGAAVMLSGVVTFERHDGFVLATTGDRDQNAIFVVRTPDTAGPVEINEGDSLRVEGRTCVWENIAAVEAILLTRTGRKPLPYPNKPKWYDVRQGWRNLRRARLQGIIAAVDHQNRLEDNHPETVLTLQNWEGKFSIHVAGHVNENIARVGNTVEAIGIVRNIFNESGRVLASIFEVSSPEGINVIATSSETLWAGVLLALGFLALLAAIGFCAAWLRARRKRMEAELLDSEHKRIAADLHDTIEQHLAGARILLDGASGVKDVPEAALKRIRMACEMLANAKLEVREAVTGFATNIKDSAMLADAIEKIANDVTSLGQAVVTADCTELKIRREITHSSSPTSLLLIIREAISNAIRHGKAKNIRICSGWSETTISNDGQPFDGNAALGPEMGHYGLSNMKERCSRHGWDLAFSTDGTWSSVKINRKSGPSDKPDGKKEAGK